MSEEDLTLEKLRIVQGLADLKNEINLMGQQMNQKFKKLDELGEEIWGNGKPGLKIDMDRFKEREKVKTWMMTSISLVLFGVVGRIVYDMLVKLGG